MKINTLWGQKDIEEETTKECRRCGKILPLAKFGTSNTFRSAGNPNNPSDRGDTKIYRWRICNSCKSASKVPTKIAKLYKKPDKLECPICHEVVDKTMIRLDHDHITNRVRGFICNDCNIGMGLLKLDYRPEMFDNVKNWLEHTKPISIISILKEVERQEENEDSQY